MNQDDKQTPTEEQVKAHNEAEEAKWQGDYKEEDLTIPYKREDKQDVSNKSESSSSDDSKSDDKSDDESASDQNTPDIEYSEPVSAITIEDPGEYKPADYSFEVTLKDGKTLKISTPDEADKLSEDPDNFETPKQLLDFIKKSTQMQNKLDKDYEKWEKDHNIFTEQLETETQRRETIENYVGEFQYLVGKGKLPAVAKEYLDADWTDPKVADQPGVREQIAILNYMEKENDLRIKAKVKPITSIIDAYNAWREDEGERKKVEKIKADEEAHRAAGEARKSASSRIAGVSPAQQGSYVPKGIAVGNPHVFDRGAAQWDD